MERTEHQHPVARRQGQKYIDASVIRLQVPVPLSGDEDLRDMIAELRALTPRPGAAFGSGEPVQPVVPAATATASRA